MTRRLDMKALMFILALAGIYFFGAGLARDPKSSMIEDFVEVILSVMLFVAAGFSGYRMQAIGLKAWPMAVGGALFGAILFGLRQYKVYELNSLGEWALDVVVPLLVAAMLLSAALLFSWGCNYFVNKME